MNLLNDILTILGSLSVIDYILYFAVITLIILVVSLIYVIQNEKEEKKEWEKENAVSEEYVVNNCNIYEEELDLKSIVNTIDENPKPLIDMTLYEEEQEQRAIISYDELIKGVRPEITYDKEELVDNVIPVKKISLNPISSNPSLNIIPGEPKIEVDPMLSTVKQTTQASSINLFHYEKEEAFLKALKQLNELLN